MKRLTVILLAAAVTLALPTAAFAGSMTNKTALKTALGDAGLSKKQVTRVEAEREKGVIEVEFVQKKNGNEYEYKFRASDGKVIKRDIDYVYKRNSSKARVGKKAALKKVAKHSKIKYSVVKKARCTYEYDDREGTYTVKLKNKGYKHEFEVLAPTGKVIEWEKKLVKK